MQNVVILAGRLTGVAQRPVGAQGRTLYELRIEVTKPAARGREAETMTVPVRCVASMTDRLPPWQLVRGLPSTGATALDGL
jgi:hypothetical protein